MSGLVVLLLIMVERVRRSKQPQTVDVLAAVPQATQKVEMVVLAVVAEMEEKAV